MKSDIQLRRQYCGARIRELRIRQNLTQEELASKVHTSNSNLAKIEAGVSNPSLDLLIELRNYFNIPIDYLLLGPEELPNEFLSILHLAIKSLTKLEEKVRDLNINA